jgi:O-methyltransferase
MLGLHVHRLIRRFGYELKRPTSGLVPAEKDLVRRVKPFTATSPARIVGLVDAVRYVVKNSIAGSFVECGVWRGGSIMTMAWTLLELGDTSRDLYLYDTFEGMSAPTDKDRLVDGSPVADVLTQMDRTAGDNLWAFAPFEAVKRNVLSTGYPVDKVHFVEGKVEDTLPARAPESIALLRLDTDWYESTRHEMIHLYPRLCPRGVLILDDYGDWQGARQAVDEYFAAQPFTPLLSRMDTTGRMLVKPDR